MTRKTALQKASPHPHLKYAHGNFSALFSMGGIPAMGAKGERLLLFIGIIDILQSYR